MADNIYKYQDENGIWHFTDRAPEEGTKFETVFMQREREDRREAENPNRISGTVHPTPSRASARRAADSKNGFPGMSRSAAGGRSPGKGFAFPRGGG